MNSYQTPETFNEENWTQFVMIAYHQLYHARYLARNIPKEWEKKDSPCDSSKLIPLSPSKVKRDFSRVLKLFPKIARNATPRGASKGRVEGSKIGERPDCQTMIKPKKERSKKTSVSITWKLKNEVKFLKPKIN